ncbi:MAG: hypothetical protein HQL31_04100 [Planctomycetes bacterium]|nr:hypothetical protein [Planctomycetota bacterium]
MKLASIITIVNISVVSAFLIAYIWTDVFRILDLKLILKIAASFAIANIAIVAISLIHREYISEGQMKKDKLID